MKVVAFNGSPRKNGNTHILLETVLAELEKEGIETELVDLGTKPLNGCIACAQCFKNKNKRCVLTHDPVNEYIEKMCEADGIIFGSPTYVSDVSSNLKALMDRAGFVAKANKDMLKRKVGAGVVAVRRCGAAHVFSSINYFFLISEMIVPGSSYWNMAIGRDPGDVKNDAEGMQTMVDLGKNMAWLLKKIND